MKRGEPIPRTGRRSRHRYLNSNGAGRPNGVSAGSHVVSHRYADEGEKGPAIRREIRRREARMWRAEVEAELWHGEW